jgi:hypothetical protein
MEPIIHVYWASKDGKPHDDYFCTREAGVAIWGNIVSELTYVTICEIPREGMIKFLGHLPLDHVIIDLEGEGHGCAARN